MVPNSTHAARVARICLMAMAMVCSLGLVVAGSAHAAECTKTGTRYGDYITGTKHKDIICGKGGNDVLIGRRGNDVLKGSGGDDVLRGGPGSDKLMGQAGKDTAAYVDSAAAVTVDLAARTASGDGSDELSGIENGTGSPQGDTLTGNGAVNVVHGGDGSDTIDGGGGDDILAGEAGTDTVSFANATGAVTIDLAAGTASGDGADVLVTFENVTGSPQDDTINGDGGVNALSGGGGDDTVAGAIGNDQLNGDAGNDQLHGDPDDDSLNGGLGDDLLDGGTGTNACNGGGQPGDQLLDNCDSNAPVLTSFQVAPSSIDTSGSGQQVVVTLHLTDDLSGVDESGSRVGTTSPTSAPGPQAALQLTSGTSTDGTYTATLNVPHYAATGAWKLDLDAVDNAGNHLTKTSPQLVAGGFPGGFSQTGAGDSAAPIVSSFGVAPGSIDTSEGPANVTVTLHASDNLSGVDLAGSQVSATPPGGGQSIQGTLQLTSGNSSDGDYEAVIAVPQGSPAGTWSVDAVIADVAGNQVTPSGTFAQTGDATAPAIASMAAVPDPIDTGPGAATLTVTLQLTDDLSGVDPVASHVNIADPSGNPQGQSSLSLTSGGPLNGTYDATFNVPQDSERGTWTMSVTLVDVDGNQVVLQSDDLIGAGLPGTFANTDLQPT